MLGIRPSGTSGLIASSVICHVFNEHVHVPRWSSRCSGECRPRNKESKRTMSAVGKDQGVGARCVPRPKAERAGDIWPETSQCQDNVRGGPGERQWCGCRAGTVGWCSRRGRGEAHGRSPGKEAETTLCPERCSRIMGPSERVRADRPETNGGQCLGMVTARGSRTALFCMRLSLSSLGYFNNPYACELAYPRSFQKS